MTYNKCMICGEKINSSLFCSEKCAYSSYAQNYKNYYGYNETTNARHKSDLLRFKYINQYLENLKGADILDIGATEGNVHKMLINSNANNFIYSLDFKGTPDFKVDLNNPKDLNKKFDIIIAGEIIEHLENPTSFINYCFRHLKTSGRLILTTPNSIGIQYLRNEAWCVSGEYPHINSFTIPMLCILLEQNGFRVQEKKKINAFWKNINPLQLIPFIIPKLKTDLLIVGEKE